LPRPTTARMIPPPRRSIGLNSAQASNRCLSRAELEVRIHSPPAGSLQTLGPGLHTRRRAVATRS
jgi:hypothetical protein